MSDLVFSGGGRSRELEIVRRPGTRAMRLSVDPRDLPHAAKPGEKTTFRSIMIDGTEVEFSEGFGDLHTRVYELTLAGRGFGITEARPAIELVHAVRGASLSPATTEAHPAVTR